MIIIRTLHIDGFKSSHSETIILGRVNCFIGANGVGKSNVLEARRGVKRKVMEDIL